MLPRATIWTIQKIGLKALIGFTLLLIAMASVAYGLADFNPGLNARFLTRFAFLALVFSWLLARSRLKGWAAGLILGLLGGGLIFGSVSQLWGPLWAFLKAVDYLIWAYFNRVPEIPLDLTQFQLSYAEVYYGVSDLANTLWEWIFSLVYGPPYFSKLSATLVWGWTIWGLASWAGWFFRRHNSPVIGLLPAGTLLAAGLSYTWSGTSPLVPVVFAGLLLLALTNYDLSEQRWKSARMDYPEDLPKEFSMLTVAVVTGIVGAAIIVPIFSIRNIVQIAQKFTHSSIEEAEPVIQSLGVQQKPLETKGMGNALSAGLPRRHLMGSGPELSEQIVMSVKISGGLPEDQESYLSLPLYWRSLTYEEYTGIGWRSQDIVLRSYAAGDEAISTGSPYHQVIQQDFRLANAQNNNLYAAGDIITANHDFKIAWRPTLRFTEIDNAPGDFFGAVIEAATYRVQSLVPIVSEEDLRAASGLYPSWVSDWYLSLPESVPNRVHALAQEITANDLTAYDQARSIEQYLRAYEYSLDLDLPSLDRDMVDYFLFTLKKGYCDYYASSMVVMARSLGIPARLAIGYYRGTYDEANQRYIVTEAEAHSWVEVYFQGIGWVPFEPTAGREAIERFSQETEVQAALEVDKTLHSLAPWYVRLFAGLQWNWSTILISVFGGLFMVTLGALGVERWRLARLSAPKAIEHLYQRLYAHGRGLKVPANKDNTPHEFSTTLSTRITALAQTPFWDKRLTPVLDDIQTFTQTYSRMLYSPVIMTLQDRLDALALWRQLRRRLWLARLRQFAFRRKN